MKSPATTLFALPATAQASGNTVPLGCANLDAVGVDVQVTALAGGATAVQYTLQRLGADGNWYQVWQSSSLNGTGQASASVGLGMATAAVLGTAIRLVWATTGGGTVTATGGIVGR